MKTVKRCNGKCVKGELGKRIKCLLRLITHQTNELRLTNKNTQSQLSHRNHDGPKIKRYHRVDVFINNGKQCIDFKII